MTVLPFQMLSAPTAEVAAALQDPSTREELRNEWFPTVADKPSLGPDWPNMITLGHVPHPEYTWAHGLTLAEAATQAGAELIDFTLDLLAACNLEVNVTMAVRYERGISDLAQIFADPGHMGGSDGIFIGDHLHPRAYGSFDRYLKEFIPDHWDWPQATWRLSTHPATRFHLGARGHIAPGRVGDVIVVDPKASDHATYTTPHALSQGIDDVLVAGVPVLRDGELTGATPGVGICKTYGGKL